MHRNAFMPKCGSASRWLFSVEAARGLALVTSIFLAFSFFAFSCNVQLPADEQSGSRITEQPEPEAADHFQKAVRPVLQKFCGDCHEDSDDSDVAFLDATTAEQMDAQRGLWKSVAMQLRNRTMPPADEAQPEEADRMRISLRIENQLRSSACSQGDFAGSVIPRRLNRNEYDNTLRDLLGIDLHLSESFPVDGSGGEGFDNNGETLFLSPLLVERYLSAADEAVSQVILVPAIDITIAAADLLPAIKDQEKHDEHKEARLLKPDSELIAIVRILNDGEHKISFKGRSASDSESKVALVIDGIPAEELALPAADKDSATNKDNKQLQSVASSINLSRGMHAIGLRTDGKASLRIVDLRIEQHKREIDVGDIARHERLLGVAPGNMQDKSADQARKQATESIRRFASAAFRRPVTDNEVAKFLRIYDRGQQRGDPFEACMRLAIKTVLVSPQFLFRIEQPAAGKEIEPISDLELATRLSYFLNATMPDEQLLRDARAGKLNKDKVLIAHVDRLLAKPESDELYFEFVGQWLGTRGVSELVIPLADMFQGQYTTPVLQDMRREPVELFAHLVRENRSLMEMIDPDYVIVSGQLAKHYGLLDEPELKQAAVIKKWKKAGKKNQTEFEMVTGVNERRGGLVSMGAVHLLTSYPDRTSPVLRGGWILETLLGVRVPSPPPDIPELPRTKKVRTVREQLEKHREHQACAACHNLMDPLGFALDNYDLLSKWRETERKAPIDPSAKLPSGEKFSGPEGLRKMLLQRKDELTIQMTRKLLGYALGRSLDDRDDCTVNRIADKLKASDYKARLLIHEIVLSTPFRNRQLVERRASAEKEKSLSEKRIEIQRKFDE